jgi:hypothetical protein
MTAKTSFPSAYDLAAPAGAEAWRDLYPYYLMFADNRRAEEDGKFWFCDSQHWPNPFKPFDAVTVEYRGQMPGSVQHPPPSGAARQWHRFPHPQRLCLHVSPSPSRPRISAPACRNSWTAPVTIS